MDYTTIQNAATKIVDNIKSIDGSINALQNKQDIISTSDMSMANSHNGKLKIEEIGGKCEQFSTSGKNLLENTATNQTINGGTVTVNEDKSVTITGTFTADTSIVIARLPDLPSEKLILSGCPTGGSYGTYCLQYSNFYDFAYSEYGSGVDIEKFDYAEFPDTNVSIRIVSGTTMNHTFYPMIRLTSITDQTYEPYTGGIPAPNPDYPQEIKKVVVSEIKTRGKNLIKLPVVNITYHGVTVTSNNGTLTVKGTSTKDVGFNIALLNLKKGNYFTNTIVFRRDAEGTWLETIQPNTVFKILDESQQIVPLLWFAQDTSYDYTVTPMICFEEYKDGEEPYTETTIKLSEPIELYGIGDVKDTIEDGKVVRRFGKTSLVNATWIKNSEYEYYTSFDDSKYKPENYTTIFCDKIINGRKGVFINSHGKIRLHIETAEDTINTVAEVMNNSTIIAELATPITEPLPAVDQIALNNLSTYDTITYLDFDSEIEPTFQAEYGVTEIGGRVLEDLMTGLNSEILAQSDANRITALESTIVNNI